jgi:hypothetical protein
MEEATDNHCVDDPEITEGQGLLHDVQPGERVGLVTFRRELNVLIVVVRNLG